RRTERPLAWTSTLGERGYVRRRRDGPDFPGRPFHSLLPSNVRRELSRARRAGDDPLGKPVVRVDGHRVGSAASDRVYRRVGIGARASGGGVTAPPANGVQVGRRAVSDRAATAI